MNSGSEIGKPIVIASIVFVVLIVVALGYHFLGHSSAGVPDSTRQMYEKRGLTGPSQQYSGGGQGNSAGMMPHSGGN